MKDHEKPADHSALDSEGEAHRTVFRVTGDGGDQKAGQAETRMVDRGSDESPQDLPDRHKNTSLQTLNRRFVLQEEIARGGMGVVYRALDLRRQEARDRDQYVAVKVISEDFLRHYQEAFVSLQRETKKAQQLAHPNIITVYDFDRDGDTVYMTMELLRGQSLRQLMTARAGRAMPLVQALPIINGICEALKYAHHKGVVHSDIKPENIFVTEDAEIKILDFGIATAVFRSEEDSSATVFNPRQLGALTTAYAALEMFTPSQADPRDDVYSLGCVTYELLAGVHPFHKKSTLESVRDQARPQPIKGLNPCQWKTLQRALEFRREERTETVSEFCEGLKPARRGKAVLMRWMPLAMGGLAMVSLAAFLLARVLEGDTAEERLSQTRKTLPLASAALVPADTLPDGPSPVLEAGDIDSAERSRHTTPWQLSLVASQPSYKVGDSLSFRASVSQAAYLYCYYDNSQDVVRLFPNRFQPDTRMTAGQTQSIPAGDGSQGFDIVLDFPGVTEEIVCFASEQDIKSLVPARLWSTDLTPLPVQHLDDIISAYETLQPTIKMQRLHIMVPPSS